MLENKVAIITGGSRGIGKAIASRFAKEGASIALVALHSETLENAKSEIEPDCPALMSFQGDIASVEFCAKVSKETLKQFQRIDILVNCAGMITRTPVQDLDVEEWQRVLDVNLNGSFYMTREVLPAMIESSSGKIINVTSQMSRIPHPSASPSYEVSKSGLGALTRHLALHLADKGICVNSIAPGSIDTDLPKSMSDEARNRLKQAIPVGRLGEPEEVAELALFLASSKSDYITGATMSINGGSLMDC